MFKISLILTFLISYTELTQNQMTCLNSAVQVGYFNASILVSNSFGRSLPAANIYLVSPNQVLYNYQSYAG